MLHIYILVWIFLWQLKLIHILYILQPIYFSDWCLCYRCPPLSHLYNYHATDMCYVIYSTHVLYVARSVMSRSTQYM